MCVIDILFIVVVDYNQWFRSQQATGEYSINTIPRPMIQRRRRKNNNNDKRIRRISCFHLEPLNGCFICSACLLYLKKSIVNLFVVVFLLLAWFFSQSNANWIHLMKRLTNTTNNVNDPNSEKEWSGFFFMLCCRIEKMSQIEKFESERRTQTKENDILWASFRDPNCFSIDIECDLTLCAQWI